YACIDTSNGTYCAQIYDLYYEKDQAIHGSGIGGHTHDWETIAIWTLNGNITHGSVSSHGDMITRSKDELPMENDHMKVVYHKDGAGTHAFRFAGSGEEAENSYGTFVTPTITSWYELTGDNISN
ncbi:NPP1 family protein, partial [Vibrio sp. 10N.222.55.F8]